MGSGTCRRSGMQGFGYSPEKQGTGESDKPGRTILRAHFCSFWCLILYLTAGSNSLIDKIQKAAEVVASAVLPPTEHQGIRLHENHYQAVIAPSAPIEVAVPACAYNLPSCRRKGETLSRLLMQHVNHRLAYCVEPYYTCRHNCSDPAMPGAGRRRLGGDRQWQQFLSQLVSGYGG